MSKSFLIFRKYIWSFVATVFSLAFIFSPVNFVSANDWTFTDSFESYDLGDLNGRGGWAVTNYYGNPDNTVNVFTTDPSGGTEYAEIINHDSIIVTHDITPINTGIFQLRMRHNKSGLFYFYALASDAGGQLLFSIQFTESKGILLEEANKQITLLPDYNADQWYLFTIDFDNNREERGSFKIRVDDGSYSEYGYVNSESAKFDFAQIVFGSNSEGTAISAFGDVKPTPIIDTLVADFNDTATSTITTVDIDGMSIVTTSNATEAVSTETTNTDSLANVISAIDDIASTTSGDSPVEINQEEPSDTIIVSDTNAESIMSPLSQSDETVASTTPEGEVEIPPLSADTDDGGVITSEF